MKIHEYQAKELLRARGVAVPPGTVITRLGQVEQLAHELSYPVVVKAQIHAGGRGKGGGVRKAADAEELRRHVADMLNMRLITPQTGADGRIVHALLIEQGVEIVDEYYLSLLVDRESAAIALIASRAGGMDIEETARAAPDKVIRLRINPLQGVMPHHIRRALFALAPPQSQHAAWAALLRDLYGFFVENDCSLLEINPLAVCSDGTPLVLDAKIDFDDNALSRHPHIVMLRDEREEDELELRARRHHLNYIRLSGNVGNMVNGAGLAMATMDIIKAAGARPANFLDVGGGASSEMVEQGFSIICADPAVKGVFVNIFGGILRCDLLARGIVEAASKVGLQVPVVIRMEGTNVEEGKKILADAGLDLISADDLADAARKVAEMVA